MLTKILKFRNIFTLFLVILFAYGVWKAEDYAFLAKLFPYYVSGVLLFFGIIQLYMDLYQSVTNTGRDSNDSLSDLSTDWDIPIQLVWLRFFGYVSIIIFLYISIWITGYPISITIFIFIFYKFIARASLFGSFIAAAAGLGFLALASSVLGMEWPQGIFQFPWPLG